MNQISMKLEKRQITVKIRCPTNKTNVTFKIHFIKIVIKINANKHILIKIVIKTKILAFPI